MQQPRREPIFNAPPVLVGLLAVMVVVHLVRDLVLSEQSDYRVLLTYAFIPARFGALGAELPGAPWAGPVSFVSHALLHGDWLHVAINGAWLLAVGTPLARRMTALSLLGLAALCAIGGAVMFLLFQPDLAVPMVGASGAVSGLMGGMFRLMFAADTAEERHLLREHPAAAPRLSLRQTFTERRSLTAIAVWVVVNLVAAYGLADLTSGGAIAWEAHLGGFFTGLVALALFDRGRGDSGRALT